MNKKFLLTVLAGLSLSSIFTESVFAQNRPVFFGRQVNEESIAPSGHIRCLATEYNEYIFEQTKDIEVDLTDYPVYRTTSNNEILKVPVVVHVIHSGQAIGTGPNIHDAQVMSQITVLNQDYRRMMGTPGYNTEAVGADVEIEFCLAQRDPQGNPTNGINRVNLGVAAWGSEMQIRNQIQAVVQWDPTKYYNIYVVNFGSGLADTLGYAVYPYGTGLQGLYSGAGSAVDDGAVIGYKYFGSRAIFPGGTYEYGYDRGRTTTHEIGHALGLIHIWGDATNCTIDDYCSDTPMQSYPNYNCSPNTSCASPDMYRNYMDYTPDSCMNIFTVEQKNRVRQSLQYGIRRATLLTSNSCVPPSTASVNTFDLGMVTLYPNPAENIINIVTPDNYELPEEISIYNSLGQVVYTNNKISVLSDMSVDVSSFTNGVYFVKINKNQNSKTLQFIKK